MDKLAFLDTLHAAGFQAEMIAGVPTVLSNDITGDIPKIEAIVNKNEYHESFGIKKAS